MAKRYCFTLNNYGEGEYTHLREQLQEHGSYAVIGKEVGSNGTPHLQGYVIWNQRTSFEASKHRCGDRCHLEISKGTPRQNRDYCTKGGDFIEIGVCPDSGASRGRSTTVSRDELYSEYRGNFKRRRTGLVEFADAHPGAYGFSGHAMLRNTLALAEPVERPTINVEWIHGLPGVGKSRYAHSKFPSAYIKDPRTKWWNGYLLETEVIIDDFGPNGIDINHLLRWFDRYKCLVEVKGDMVPLHATSFIVTSNFTPSVCFQLVKYRHNDDVVYEDHPQLPALMRRIKLIHLSYIINVTKVNSVTNPKQIHKSTPKVYARGRVYLRQRQLL